ncbi:MAG: T9SS type A sorting domain-containing protein [Candidatus Electryonea clarkiae]|nr:T9SS type A sorting domain-containing protein [Candidatus Electryonea clarkiae]MDP8289277.1 T9SS type A sorting domain-containing protein [Candidatus Electryonea clarkiae]
MSSKYTILSIVAALVLFQVGYSAVFEGYAVKFSVESDEDVIRLAEEGFNLIDVETGIYPVAWGNRMLVEWNRENSYVTALVDEKNLGRLENLNFPQASAPIRLMSDQNSGIFNELDDPEEFEFSWGWPEQMNGFPAISHQVPTLSDLDGNGDLEVVINTIEGYLYAWQHSGGGVPGYPLDPFAPNRQETWISTRSWETGASIDIDSDGDEEVIMGTSSGIMFAFDYSPYEVEDLHWLDVGVGMFAGIPAVHDIDGNGTEELIVHIYDPFAPAPREGFLHAFDGDGYDIEGWPKIYSNPSSSSPVVGDIDGDGEPEIVIGTGQNMEDTGRILAWNADGTELDGWQVDGFYSIGGSPTLADIDGEDGLEVIIRCKEIGGTNGIYAWNSNGELVDGFPIEVPAGHPYGSVAIADMDDNGVLDFAVGTVEAEGWARVLVFEQGSGLREGFPRWPGGPWIGGSPVFADVTGDGLPEVIVSQRYSLEDNPAGLIAYDADGVEVGAAYGNEEDIQFASSPTAYDLDGDGTIELMASSVDGRIYVWDTDGIAGESMFPCEKGNFKRTGTYIENQIDFQGIEDKQSNGIPSQFSIKSIYPSPFNSSTKIIFHLPAEGKVIIKVYNLLGHEVTTLASGQYETGTHNVNWTANESLHSGMYFIKASYKGTNFIQKIVYLK